jgi:hypothetical protein
MTSLAEHSNKRVAAALRGDLYSFVQAAFPIVAAEAKLLRNWHIEAMTYALSRVLRGEIKRLIITVPPRNLKSICASVAMPAFALGHDPTRKFICVNPQLCFQSASSRMVRRRLGAEGVCQWN